MAVVSMKQLLDSGVHFGHQTRRWNPKMKRFIFTERNGIYIIDLQQTLGYIDNAYEFVKQTVAHGGSILFVGTKRQAQEVVAEQAHAGRHALRQPALAGRHAHQLPDRLQAAGAPQGARGPRADRRAGQPSKKEQLVLSREKAKLERSLGGIRDMKKVPSAIWIVDTKKEHIAVGEARKLNIPVVAILDTNCDPDEVDYKIPGNDDAIRSIAVLTRVDGRRRRRGPHGPLRRAGQRRPRGRRRAGHRWRRAAGRLGARAPDRRRRGCGPGRRRRHPAARDPGRGADGHGRRGRPDRGRPRHRRPSTGTQGAQNG